MTSKQTLDEDNDDTYMVQVKRWYVWFGKTRRVTWAETEEEARRKAENYAQMRKLKLIADRIEPAPPLGED